MKRSIAILVLSSAPALVGAQAMNDFARGAAIRAGNGSLFRVVVPDDVYETVVRDDLGDIRVLNAAGDAVPHTLRRAPGPTAAEAEWRTVPSFPMTATQTGGAGRTQVRVDANGAVLEVTGDATRKATLAYLVDVSAIEDRLTRLALTWEAPADVTFLARVSVHASNDLDTWRPLVASSAVAQLQRDRFVLTQNEIELPDSGTQPRYLRISWPSELASVTLTGVRVRPQAATTRPEIRWRTLSATGTDATGAPLYDAAAHFPVEYLDLEFQDGSDAAEVAIRSRATPDATWLGRHRGLFYALQEPAGAIRNEPARTQPTPDRYWVVERLGGGGWPSGRAPRLKVGWHPHELVFVAQGSPPYTLVYGSARAGAAGAPVDMVIARLNESDRADPLQAATLDPPRSLGGAAALRPPPPVRRLVLWTVLVLAVAALAFLALRIFRETPATTGAPPEA